MVKLFKNVYAPKQIDKFLDKLNFFKKLASQELMKSEDFH